MQKPQKNARPFRPDRPIGLQPEFRPAPGISAYHIKQACGLTNSSESRRKYHRRRIEAWGQSNREFLRSLGVRFVRKAA